MNDKKILLTLFTFLLIFLLINLASAQEDFKATSSPSVSLCPCSNQVYKVTVQNTGSVASSYTVLANIPQWVSFSPNKFILNPGQKGSFFVIVNSDCNIEGKYGLEIFITTNNGLTKVMKQPLEISECYDYSFSLGEVVEEVEDNINFVQHDGPYSICKNEQKYIPILITNNEDFENRYKMFLDAPEWAEINIVNAKIDAKKSGIFLIDLDTTGVEGEFNFKLNAISELGEVQRKETLDVSVEECYSLGLDLEKEDDSICSGENTNFEVIIKNSGTISQNVELEVEGPEWAGFEDKAAVPENKNQNSKLNQSDNESQIPVTEARLITSETKILQLNPDEEKIVLLSMNPSEDLSGNFEITISAVPDNKTEFKVSDTIKVNVIGKLKCYRADISTKASVINFYNEDFFFAKVKNEGVKKATYDVILEGVLWVSASPETLELNPGQTGNINLNVNPDVSVEPGIYGIEINLESNGAVYTKNVDITLKNESEFAKKFKSTLRTYQYYFYLAILIIILVIIFRKPLNKLKNRVQNRYNKYKVKQARLAALKLAREKRQEERDKEKELAEEKKERERKKESEKERREGKRKFNLFCKKNKFWPCILVLLIIIAAGIFLGHYYKLFNAKYIPIYIWNIVVGYLYYILMGIGIVVVLFLLILFYSYLKNRSKKGRVKKEVERADKRIRKKIKWGKVFFSVIISLILIGLASAVYLNLFDDIKDFLVLYQFYIILGIVILVVTIVLIRFYKPLFKFLE